MDIDVRNLDNAYELCKQLNSLANDKGSELISALENNVGGLKTNWKGSDATVHINNLIKVHDALVALVTDAKTLTGDAADLIIRIQQVRKSNGGSPVVGEALSKGAPASQALPLVEDTGEFFVKPEAAGLASDLADICVKFNNFTTNFGNTKDSLFNEEWHAGGGRDNIKRCFEEFATHAEEYNGYLNNAKTNLETAVANMQKI